MMADIARADPTDTTAAEEVAQLVAEAPKLDPAYAWIWRAWQRLSDDRPQHGGGMGPAVPGRIPWNIVRLWCEHHNMTRGEFVFLDRCFAEMDAAYMQWWLTTLPKSPNDPGE